MKTTFFVLTAALFSSIHLFSQNQWVTGCVFLDKNANQKMDPNEKGIANAYVSDGISLFKTNSKGVYKAQINNGAVLSVIIPEGFKLTNSSWYTIPTRQARKINFGLVKQKKSEKFNFLAVGDVQVGTSEELQMAAFSFFNEVTGSNTYDFSYFLGDLVNDTPEYFSELKSLMEFTGKPYRNVYGNHDWSHGAPVKDQDTAYINYFGPKNYAFNKGEVLFVALNTITPIGKFGYKGIYSQETLNFIKEVLDKLAKKGQLIVLTQHIPLQWMQNKKELLKLLETDHEFLILSGHTHNISRHFYKRQEGRTDIHELVCGAVSGNWWTGQKNYQGLPLSLMNGGAPKGYFKIEVDKSDYKIKYKGINLDQANQMSSWFGTDNTDQVPVWVNNEHHYMYLNYYAGSDKTEINVYMKDQYLGQMVKVDMQDPYIRRIKRLQEEEKYPNILSEKSPYRHRKSNHLWRFKLPVNRLNMINKLKVRVNDPYVTPIENELIFWNEKE